MARKITAIEVGYDQIDELNIKVGSPGWFQWLEENRSFHYSCSQGHFTANKNSKGYWYAQRRSDGNLLQHYLGQSSKLTLGSLQDAASKLALAALENRPRNRLVKALDEQSCKSCMTEEERLRQSSKGELIDLVVHLKEKLQDYKTQPTPSSQTQDEIELKARLSEIEAQLKKKDSELAEAINKIEVLEKESRDLRYRCSDLERENARLERLGTDYSHASFQVLSAKYQKSLNNAKHWEEVAGSYRRQAEAIAKKKEELEAELNAQCRQPNPEDFKETTLLRECLESCQQQQCVIEAYQIEVEEFQARITELETENQSLKKRLSEPLDCPEDLIRRKVKALGMQENLKKHQGDPKSNVRYWALARLLEALD
jgi:DNA repair exonuclease SbcCD ATPase subunit